jgi:hypothetical protein
MRGSRVTWRNLRQLMRYGDGQAMTKPAISVHIIKLRFVVLLKRLCIHGFNGLQAEISAARSTIRWPQVIDIVG